MSVVVTGTHPGLTSAEARARLASVGPNDLVPSSEHGGPWPWIRRIVTDPMVLLLLAALTVYVAFGDIRDAVVSAIALVAITAVSVALEVRTERALSALQRLADPVATVWRDGEIQRIPATQLVPDDQIVLDQGDVVSADGVLYGTARLKLDESSLTGESHPVDRTGEDAVFAGTTVLSGHTEMRITETGPRTRYGRIGTLVASIDEAMTPLQRGIRRLVMYAAAVAVVFVLAVVAVELRRGSDWPDALVAGISLAMAAIPEEFPMVFALYLGLGAWRLARHKALIRRLAKVEALGATTVIATDKTGTLTTGRVEVGALIGAGGARVAGDAAAIVLGAAVLASELEGADPLDQAIVRHATELGHVRAPRDGRVLLESFPFDPQGKHVTQVWQVDGSPRSFSKGALEPMLDRVHALPAVRGPLEAANAQLARTGMRVLAVASGRPRSFGSRDAAERELQIAGLVAFSDPVRAGVLEALEQCREAGIRVIMITGDHPLTALAIAAELGIAAGDARVVTGGELAMLPAVEVPDLVRSVNVFARVEASQKHQLVRALQAQHQVVAMTGDGTNDAPALREADIGIAMGRRGTEVARAAAAMVLLDDDFATIVRAIAGGRRIFDNLRRAFAYLVAFHVPLLIAAFAVPLLGAPLLLLPVHLVFLEIVLHPTVSLVFEGDAGSADLMRRPPRDADQGLVSRQDLGRALLIGATLTIGVLLLYFMAMSRGDTLSHARTLGWATLIVGQLVLVIVSRAGEHTLRSVDYRGHRTLFPILALTALSLVASTYVPAIRDLLSTAALTPLDWVTVIAAAAIGTLWLEPMKTPPGRRRIGSRKGIIGRQPA